MQSPSGISKAEALYYEALDLLAANQPGRAVALLRRSLAADSRMNDARHALIRALEECGELDEAIAMAKQLSEIEPDEPLAHTRLSILYQRQGLIAEAEAEALRAKLLGWKKQLREP